MTAARIAAYNAGVRAMISLSKRAAEAIAARNTRTLAEGFAVEVLEELALCGEELMLLVKADRGSDTIEAR